IRPCPTVTLGSAPRPHLHLPERHRRHPPVPASAFLRNTGGIRLPSPRRRPPPPFPTPPAAASLPHAAGRRVPPQRRPPPPPSPTPPSAACLSRAALRAACLPRATLRCLPPGVLPPRIFRAMPIAPSTGRLLPPQQQLRWRAQVHWLSGLLSLPLVYSPRGE
uniref:Uncharacterized protein n=2 Tax=Aegilops tauschii subsp. strangulata TaxID=200361 RepID=A0A453RTZ7_AEGTS